MGLDVGGAASGAAMGSSIGGPWGAAAGGVAGALGLFGGGEDPQAAALAQARKDLEDIGLPPDLSYEIALKQFREAGTLTPQQEEAYRQSYSNVAGVQEDLTGRDAQVDALNLLKERGMGLGAEERSAFSEMRDMTQRDAQAKQQQIMNQMAARGQGGSGAELMAALQGAQASNTRLSQEGDRLGATAASNALQAISQSGQLGGQLRSADYGAQMDKAKSLDAMEQFNLQNSQAVQQRNISAMNQAEAANLANKQNLANANIQMANTETYRQEQAKRDYWNDKYKQAAAKSGTSISEAQMAGNQPSELQQIGSALGTIGGAYSKANDGATMGGDAASWVSDKYDTYKTDQAEYDYEESHGLT